MFDLVVLGGGPGGYAAAIRAAQLGARVALVESAEIGGTCVNRGCIPTKIWMRAAYLLHWLRRGETFGIKATLEDPDLKVLVDRKNGISSDTRLGMEGILKNREVEIIRGFGILKNPKEVEVEGAVLEAKKIILATGSCLDIPDIPGLEAAILTTDQILEMTKAPNSALIWGGGHIELEMATLLNAFGCKVHMVPGPEGLLPKEDRTIRQWVTNGLKQEGVEVLRRLTLDSIHNSEGSHKVQLSGADEKTLEVERVVIASRKPAIANIGSETIGLRLNSDGGIWVKDTLETSVKGIFAIGDVTGGWMLAHAASSMAVTAAENAMGKKSSFPFHLTPRGIWTLPEVGSVGLTEKEAKKRGIEFNVGDFPFSINGLAMARDQMEGTVKIISEARTGEILGVHIVGANATELIGEAVLAMQLEATVRELAYNIRVHPTFSESIVDSARDVGEWALHLPKR